MYEIMIIICIKGFTLFFSCVLQYIEIINMPLNIFQNVILIVSIISNQYIIMYLTHLYC